MKILFVASVFRHFTAFHLPYMEYFQYMGYEVWAAGIGQEGKEDLEKVNVKCIDIPFSRSPLGSENIEAYRALKKLFETEVFELVHVHTPVASVLTRAAFRKSKHGKLVYTVHGFHFYKGAPKHNWLIYYTAEKIAARWTDHLITINKEDYINAQKLLPNDQISYVHGVGVEFDTVRLSEAEKMDLRQEIGLTEDHVIISFVAELNENKNHRFLLHNWSRLKENCPRAALCIIGTGELEPQLKEIVETENLQDVHFLGYRRDVPSLLQVSDIVTLLSQREGLPKSIMEAMVEGLPCVVTNTRGLRDLISDGKNGYVVNHGDKDALVNAFGRLVESKQLRETMGEQARGLVQPYLLENVLMEYVEVYKKLL